MSETITINVAQSGTTDTITISQAARGPEGPQGPAGDVTNPLTEDLQTDGFSVVIQESGGAESGQMGTDGEGNTFLVKTTDSGYDPANGGILATPSGLQLHGSVIRGVNLNEAEGRSRELWITGDGDFYGVLPDPPSFEDSASSSSDFDLGTGTGVGSWVKVSDMEVTLPVPIAPGDRLDIFTQLTVVNKTSNRAGTIEIGWGLDDAAPTSGITENISDGFDSPIPVNITLTSTTLPAGSRIHVWARRTSGDNSQFGVDLLGSQLDHQLEISGPTPVAAAIAGLVGVAEAGNLFGMTHGEIWTDSELHSVSTQNADTFWKVFGDFEEDGEALRTTLDKDNSQIICQQKGRYRVTLGFSGTLQANRNVDFGVRLKNSLDAEQSIRRLFRLRDGGDTQSGTGSFYIEADEGDRFQAMFKGSAIATVDPDTFSLTVERVSYQIPTIP